MPDTALTVDSNGRILTWSRDAEALLGYSEAEAIGQSVELIIPSEFRSRHAAGFARFVQTGVTTLPEVLTAPAVHKSGHALELRFSVKAVYGEQKSIVGVAATFAQ